GRRRPLRRPRRRGRRPAAGRRPPRAHPVRDEGRPSLEERALIAFPAYTQRMKRPPPALLLLAACAGRQVIPPEKPEGQPERPERPSERVPERPPQPTVIIEDGMRLEYRPHGRTVIEVTEPEGTQVQAFDGPALVASDTVPLAFDALPDHYYRFVFQMPGGTMREKKLQARAGQLLSVRVLEA